jgi:cytochrome P450
MDTTSGMRSRILHLVASHSEVQDRLREEIKQAYSGKDELTYDELDALPFLDAVCRETLRL